MNKIYKKIFFLFIIMALFLSVSPAVLADDDDNDERNERSEKRYELQQNDDAVIQPISAPEPVDDKPVTQPVIVQPEEKIQDPERVIIPKTTKTVSENKNLVLPVISKTNVASSPNRELMDSDLDGIADANDRHENFDDFAYNIVDKNGNGLADDLEVLIK